MSTFQRIADLPLQIDSVTCQPLSQALGEWTRATTVVELSGGGVTGRGEDVTYDPELHPPFQERLPGLPLAGSHTLRSFSELVGSLDLFEGAPPTMPAYTDYRRWAVESAALDLALLQSGISLGEAVGREPRPVRFVASLGLGKPPSIDPVRRRMAAAPSVGLKLDATSEWTNELIAELVALDRVEAIDLKGAYHGTAVDQPADPDLYRRVVEAFPHAFIEDPALTPETDAILAPHRDRVTWDAVIHTAADVEALPFPPRVINVKPSRSGSLETLFGLYDHLEARGIGAYGGGQTELSVGRGHIQTLAAHFHPDSSNDVAPREFNLTETPAQLPASPLELDLSQPGFGPR